MHNQMMCKGRGPSDGRGVARGMPGKCPHIAAKARVEAEGEHQRPVRCCQKGGTAVEAASVSRRSWPFTVAPRAAASVRQKR